MQSSLRRVGALLLTLLALTACGPAESGPDDGTGTGDKPAQTTPAPVVDPATTPGGTTALAPAVTTAPPAETTVPAPVTTAAPITASGKFSSETGSNLEIHLEWSVIGQTDTAVTVRAEAYITHYEIWVSARHGGKLTIGKSSQSFSTEAITYDGKGKQTVTLTTATVDVPLGADGTATVDISVSWPFIGTYSGIKIDNLTCGGTIHIGQQSKPAAQPETTAAPVTTAAPETTAAPAPVETPITEQGEPLLFKSTVFVDRNASHFGSVTLVRSTAELSRLLEAHPADCKNAVCAAITAACAAYDDAFFAGKALLLVPQGSRYSTASPVEVFDVRADAGALYVHIRDIVPSRTTEQLLSTRFYLQTVEIPADSLTGRTINVVQHGAYYTDSGKYERDYLRDEGTVTAPTTRSYQPAAITP